VVSNRIEVEGAVGHVDTGYRPSRSCVEAEPNGWRVAGG